MTTLEQKYAIGTKHTMPHPYAGQELQDGTIVPQEAEATVLNHTQTRPKGRGQNYQEDGVIFWFGDCEQEIPWNLLAEWE